MRREKRGQSAVVGVVLLIGLVVIGSVGILLLSGQVNEESRQRAETERVEQAFLALGSNIDTVSRTDGGERVVDLDLPGDGESVRHDADAGRIWLNRTNLTSGQTTVLVNRSVGAVRYEDDRTVFGYQSGAVFRGTGNGTRVLSRPSFQYAVNRTGGDPTLTLPIVTTKGTDSVAGGRVRVRRVDTESPINDDVVVENSLVSVTVRSEWYVGWAAYFRSLAQRSGVADLAVEVDHGRRTATLQLVVPTERPTVRAGVVGASEADDFVFSNNIVLDAYNSNDGQYDATNTSATDVEVAGNLTLNSSITIDGDVAVGKHLQINDSPTITGNASYGSVDPDPPDSYVDGWYNDNSSVGGLDDVDGLIDTRTLTLRQSNDNDDAPISGGTLDGCGSTCTLSAGSYYLEELKLTNGDRLELRPGDERIELAVNGTVNVTKATIALDGAAGRVNVYVNSERPGTEDVLVDQSTVTVPGNESDRLWWYVDKDGSGKFTGGNTVFNGVVFGPGTESEPGFDTVVRNSGEYYGALVADVNSLGQNMGLHYDRALRDAETVTASTTPSVTFLVATSYVVEVESESD